MLLQIPDVSVFQQYGPVGILALCCIIALVAIFKAYTAQIEKRMQAMEANLAEEKQARISLQDRLDEYMRVDTKAVLTGLEKSTDALENNNALLIQIKEKIK
jgi:hypothetical protein